MKIELLSERLLLREQEERDVEAANAYERDPATMRYQTSDVRTFDESLAYIRRAILSAKEDPRRVYDFAIVERANADDRMIGRAGMEIKSVEQREAALWYMLAPSARGRGYAREAVGRLVKFAFEELKLHRLYADIDPRNFASMKVCEALGMRKEAHFIENLYLKGEWTDSVIYGILDREHRR